MVDLWYARITVLKTSTLADVPERYYEHVKQKLIDNGYL